MFVKIISACDAFVANDGCTIRELLHPKNDPVDLPYSLALATVDIGQQSYQHKLKQTEVYHILQGHGRIFIENEDSEVGLAISLPYLQRHFSGLKILVVNR